jgi:hypothetical protein
MSIRTEDTNHMPPYSLATTVLVVFLESLKCTSAIGMISPTELSSLEPAHVGACNERDVGFKSLMTPVTARTTTERIQMIGGNPVTNTIKDMTPTKKSG